MDGGNSETSNRPDDSGLDSRNVWHIGAPFIGLIQRDLAGKIWGGRSISILS